jgi:hypothetical protein
MLKLTESTSRRSPIPIVSLIVLKTFGPTRAPKSPPIFIEAGRFSDTKRIVEAELSRMI